MMRCSVIIPVYNKARYIGMALRSVLDQTHSDVEIVVVDDGSTDDSAQRVAKIGDPRVRLLVQTNQGVSAARNAGIAAATGDLVCFLDADDCYHPDYLRTMVQMAASHSDHAFFSSAYVELWNTEDYSRLDGPTSPSPPRVVRDFYKEWRRKQMLCTNSAAVRRDALLALQPCFPPGESMAEDQDLWFRLVERHGLLHCPTPLVAYRKDVASSLTRSAANRRSATLHPAYLRLEQRARSGEMPAYHVRSALLLVADKRITLARSMLASGQRREALKHLLNVEHGMKLRRWWLALAMCLVGGPEWMRRWDLLRARGWPRRHKS